MGCVRLNCELSGGRFKYKESRVVDLLLNNMAWVLRRFPVFPVFGHGYYPVQPLTRRTWRPRRWRWFAGRQLCRRRRLTRDIHLRAVVAAVGLGGGRPRQTGAYAAGGGIRPNPVGGPAAAGRGALPRRGIGLMAGSLTSNFAPTGMTRLDGWLAGNRSALGRRYVSELTRNHGH